LQIFRAVHHLLITTVHDPFLSLPSSFKAKSAIPPTTNSADGGTDLERDTTRINPAVPTAKMFATAPEDIDGDWLKNSRNFQRGIARIGQLLSGGRA
jgi:hypothetical protein